MATFAGAEYSKTPVPDMSFQPGHSLRAYQPRYVIIHGIFSGFLSQELYWSILGLIKAMQIYYKHQECIHFAKLGIFRPQFGAKDALFSSNFDTLCGETPLI